jgi:hypothetical protein
MKKTYTVKQLSNLVGKSRNLIYRRLTEKPRKYIVKFARKEGETWVFDRQKVDNAIQMNESLIIRADNHKAIDINEALTYFIKEAKSCGKEILDYD